MKTLELNNRDHLKLLRASLAQALALIEEDYNIKVDLGHCSYQGHGKSCTFKMEVKTVEEGGEVFSKEAADLEMYSKILELPDNYKEMWFPANGNKWQIIGYKTRSRKYNMVCRNESGKELLFTESVIKRLV